MWLLLCASNGVSSAPIIPQSGLVSFWDFQERSGPFVAKLGRGRYAFQEKSFDPSTRVWSSNNEVRRVQDAPPSRGPRGEVGKGNRAGRRKAQGKGSGKGKRRKK